MNSNDELCGVAHKVGCAVSVQRIADVDQVMRHSGQFCRTGLGRANVHAAINQSRIDADDFYRMGVCKGLCNGECPCGFSAGRWPSQSYTFHCITAHRGLPVVVPTSTPVVCGFLCGLLSVKRQATRASVSAPKTRKKNIAMHQSKNKFTVDANAQPALASSRDRVATINAREGGGYFMWSEGSLNARA
jgi:hypothetical protein